MRHWLPRGRAGKDFTPPPGYRQGRFERGARGGHR